MKTMKKVFAMMLTICMLSCVSIAVNAASDPSYTRYTTVTVSAGGSTYTTQLSFTSTTQSSCYMRLRRFQFSGYSENYIPSGHYIYSRLYTQSTHIKASNYASFSGPTSQGHYNYSYLSGYGGAGQGYCLKTNSSWNVSYEASFDWSANPF